ncbi:MAG: hypothetical protein U1E38_03180 [Rhodospirillales bacterium]
MRAIEAARMLLAAAVVLGAGACSGEDWPRLVGQGLYNAGRYLCTQSADCDTPGGGPGSTSNRR